MNKLFILLALHFMAVLSLRAQQPNSLELLAHLPYDTATLAGCWHYVDSMGGEYALVGTSKGLSIVDLRVPTQPKQLFSVYGLTNNWREVKTWAGFAYVGSEAQGSAITIVDLRHLPDTIYTKVWTGDGQYEGQIRTSHTVTCADGYLYINGGSMITNGAIICDIADPWNPKVVGKYAESYLHDSFVRGDTLWGSEIYNGRFNVVDISDKTNPVVLTNNPTPGQFNHNVWLSDDSKILFAADEKSNAPLASFDVSDLYNIRLLDTYYPSQQPSREVHNVRVLGNFLVNPSYGGQLTIVDATHPDNLIETGFASLGSSLVWDADPYLPSGILFATAKSEGLFIYKPTYQQAAYLEGTVTDAVSGVTLPGANLTVVSTVNTAVTNAIGQYKTGASDAGEYAVLVEKAGYLPKTIPSVSLQTGQITSLNVQLTPESVQTNELAVAENIRVLPTLFKHCLTVEIPLESPFAIQGTSVRLADMHGKTLIEAQTTGTLTEICTAESLPAGQYLLFLQNEKGRSIPKRLVKS